MSKCARGEHITNIARLQHLKETEIIDAHSGLSDAGTVCVVKLCGRSSICLIQIVLPLYNWSTTVYNTFVRIECAEFKCVHLGHAIHYVYKCLTKCIVLMTVGPPS